MNVGQLKKMLETYPNEMVVLNERFSDYAIVQPEDWSVVCGVDNDGWVMRSHPTMSAENKAKEKSYLLLIGN